MKVINIVWMMLLVSLLVLPCHAAVKTLGNGWTVVTRDGQCSAHFEHTIALVQGGCEVLTKKE